ncbi:MAG: hypothetical protein L6V93_04725 [Clostridiales bacterium]|nr:MAG: hypothetical protein L6V93_04725 [Clostridiales bacterium]
MIFFSVLYVNISSPADSTASSMLKYALVRIPVKMFSASVAALMPTPASASTLKKPCSEIEFSV